MATNGRLPRGAASKASQRHRWGWSAPSEAPSISASGFGVQCTRKRQRLHTIPSGKAGACRCPSCSCGPHDAFCRWGHGRGPLKRSRRSPLIDSTMTSYRALSAALMAKVAASLLLSLPHRAESQLNGNWNWNHNYFCRYAQVFCNGGGGEEEEEPPTPTPTSKPTRKKKKEKKKTKKTKKPTASPAVEPNLYQVRCGGVRASCKRGRRLLQSARAGVASSSGARVQLGGLEALMLVSQLRSPPCPSRHRLLRLQLRQRIRHGQLLHPR